MRPAATARFALALALFASACAPPTSVLELVGTYSLQSMNGAPLPYVFPLIGATKVTALDDAFQLTSTGTFAEAGHKTFTTAGIVSLATPVDAGSFTRRGNVLTFESLLYGTSTGTIDDGTLTIVSQGVTLVYRR